MYLIFSNPTIAFVFYCFNPSLDLCLNKTETKHAIFFLKLIHHVSMTFRYSYWKTRQKYGWKTRFVVVCHHIHMTVPHFLHSSRPVIASYSIFLMGGVGAFLNMFLELRREASLQEGVAGDLESLISSRTGWPKS